MTLRLPCREDFEDEEKREANQLMVRMKDRPRHRRKFLRTLVVLACTTSIHILSIISASSTLNTPSVSIAAHSRNKDAAVCFFKAIPLVGVGSCQTSTENVQPVSAISIQ
jgi:hypothetical protein